MRQAAILLILLLLTGCRINRQVSKDIDKTESKVSVSTQSQATTKAAETTKITNRTDDTATMPPVNMSASSVGKAVTSVVNGDTLRATYDPVKNTIHAAFTGGAKKVPVRKEVITETTKETVSEVKTDRDSTADNSTVSKVINAKTKVTSWWWIAVVVAALAGAFYLARKYKVIDKVRKLI